MVSTRLPLVVALVSLAAVASATPLAPWLIRPATALIERGTGLRMGRAVPIVDMDESQARVYLTRDLDEEVADQDLPAQAMLLQRLGFFPGVVDLKRAALDLISSQVAAFYDPKTGKFYNVGRYGALDAVGEPVVVAHELTHALQDQLRGLKALADGRRTNDDGAMALKWALEGHATVVGNRAGNTVWPVPGPAGWAFGEGTTWAGWTPVFAQVAATTARMTTPGEPPPPYLMDSLISPYLDGSRAFWTVEAALGQRAHLLWICHPARSTEELLHPQKYLRHDDAPLRVEVPVAGARVRASMVMGEWSLRWLLRQRGVVDPDRAAEGWGGDRAVLLDDGRVAWRVVMDTERDAVNLARAMPDAVRRGRQLIMVSGGEIDLDAVFAAAVVPVDADLPPAPGLPCAGVAAPTALR